MLLPILGGPSSLPVVVVQPDEKHANRIASLLSSITDMKHANLVQTMKKRLKNGIEAKILKENKRVFLL